MGRLGCPKLINLYNSRMHNPFDSIIPCFGSRFTVLTLPHARQYRVHPLGTFHYFDWQKTDNVGISIGTCPQIITSETARIGVRANGVTRILPFAEGETFLHCGQEISALTTQLHATDPQLKLSMSVTFRSLFYPQDMQFSAAPCYSIEIEVGGSEVAEAEIIFGLPLKNPEQIDNGFYSAEPIPFPDGIDHTGIDNLIFEQTIWAENAQLAIEDGYATLRIAKGVSAGETQTVTIYHAGYIAEPTLNVQGVPRKFGYTELWGNSAEIINWYIQNQAQITANSQLFESTIEDATLPPELKQIMAATFKGLASNAWWGTDNWFTIMEIGAYHATLDVDYQLCLFFFQYWPQLVGTMLDQWAMYYEVGSGYMAHDIGQHLEATGNRYGGPDSAMKVEENCNYILLLWHYWQATGDNAIFANKQQLLGELVNFLIAADTNGSGLPNNDCDNTNDWGSTLITTSEEQSYHGVRLIMAFSAMAEMAAGWGDDELVNRCRVQAELCNASLEAGWLGDHYPISLADPDSFHHYSMWTTHGLLYPLRGGLETPIDIEKLKIDLISSTARTLREHGTVHSSADIRGWLTQNLWRDCIAAYLGIDHTHLLRRYLGHGEYVSYEDTTILEVANELMVVQGATAAHKHAGETHAVPMVDGHPRPACAFGLPYALAGIVVSHSSELKTNPIAFPLRIPLTHSADWQNRKLEWLECTRSIPNQDNGYKPSLITTQIGVVAGH